MDENWHKFSFLGIILLLVVFSNRSAVFSKPPAVADANFMTDAKSAPPIFVLESPSKIPESGLKSATPSETNNASILEKILGDSISANETTSSLQNDTNPALNSANVSESLGAVESSNDPTKQLFYRYGNGSVPQTSAHAVLVADLLSGQVYFELKPNMRWPLASLTKLMTGVIVSRGISVNQSTTLTEADFPTDYSPDMGIGDRFTIGDLRLAMFVESNNEAATAIANFYGYTDFVAAMNAQAKNWGLADTNYDGSVGLSSANQSTAFNLLSLAQKIYNQYPEIFKITTNKSVYITELNSGRKISVKNINIFAGEYDFLGGKTGFTDEASGNLLSLFSYEKRPILVIVLGSDDRFNDTHNLINWFENNYK
ncbi:MAG: D-alanyl-D-alanine carboxypeptidase [Patescibacteria group bacterium]|nr:serine hydrolase [Patescibacteria group bacterium]MDE2015827.1 D-alanyl-D-alanine carboxypeptidase [Patescibacteria group bacterium]MDE2227202.1 D-alanyl-D-alanine carboxypeptidase [Patescibacteria group bacterium]